MGDPRKLRNKYRRPKKLWDVARIGEDRGLKKDFGLKNTREIWVASAELKKYRREARRLLALTEEERKKDEPIIIGKLSRMGILDKSATLDDVLSLTVKHILERRLQTVVMRKGLARTTRQSRQLITHGFIKVDGRVVSSPSYLVDSDEEGTVAYAKKIDISVKAEKPVEKKEAPKEEKAPEKPEGAVAS